MIQIQVIYIFIPNKYCHYLLAPVALSFAWNTGQPYSVLRGSFISLISLSDIGKFKPNSQHILPRYSVASFYAIIYGLVSGNSYIEFLTLRRKETEDPSCLQQPSSDGSCDRMTECLVDPLPLTQSSKRKPKENKKKQEEETFDNYR
ncbi:hypothetical protein CEXT_16221 [Caerostris extrusa]|uniref:Uncharacterized protein n=1 Tax=Caerostris extrusa TaxID=172846 RepID=A0AAV4NDB3_CAEEX|nr:hypothetical protein CEXT_16221 [Caerostris extrusa]